jgi:hypothetical protein
MEFLSLNKNEPPNVNKLTERERNRIHQVACLEKMIAAVDFQILELQKLKNNMLLQLEFNYL